MTQPRTPSDPAGHYVYGRLVLDLTDRLNATASFEKAAQLVDQVLEPTDGLLERLAEFFEAAAEKAKESEHHDGPDLSYDFQDATATLRALGEDLHVAVDRLKALAPPQRHGRRKAVADTAAVHGSPGLPDPQSGPSTGRTR
ncbi:hypothetical protein [Streptomyces deccanensis]|uniref:hypothetical protein n=1 Tax=Streptomyces deccanensis TaxID=424188 RepID=UPI001EFBE9EC|nr:hypothetical protein [Streptomyces deccanensis]ULR48468.1 hypothetical protein L3078_03810 [Streptomyces deccanensis]